MKLCFLDFESYWSVTHSLTKMNPIVYVMHPDTEIVSVALRIDTAKRRGETEVIFGEDAIAERFAQIDWSDMMAVGHNMAGFDSMILAWRFGVRPKMWGCTLSMARPFFQSSVGGSLARVASALGVGEKGSLEATNTKGKRLEDFTEDELAAMRVYNKQDTDLCAGIFYALAPRLPAAEMKLIDMTVKMLVDPQFEVDEQLLESTLESERERKRRVLLDLAALLDANGIECAGEDEDDIADAVRSALASSAKFGKLLKALGREVPMKPSPTNPDKQVPALAKTDEAFVAMQTDKDPLVGAAARARLGVKSTILETRMASFLEVSRACQGKMPIFLNYYAATTGRWGGGGGLNQQNMMRIPRDKQGNIIEKPSNALRLSLRAPKGYKVVVADLAGIELRVNHFLWQATSSVALYRADPVNADLYKDFASKLYNVEVSEVTKEQRQIGKISHLGLGFGAGPVTFKKVAKLMGGVDLSDEESYNIVQRWRSEYSDIKRGWRRCSDALFHILNKEYGVQIDPAGLIVTHEEGLKTPVGMIRYPHLEYVQDESTFWYGEGRNRQRITGPKCDENIVQHLARCIISEQMLAINRRYKVALTVHDEVVVVVPEQEAEECLAFMLDTMKTSPAWWPDILLSAEGDVADSYGNAK